MNVWAWNKEIFIMYILNAPGQNKQLFLNTPRKQRKNWPNGKKYE